MTRYKTERKQPSQRPVQHVELDESHFGLRLAVMLLCITVGVTAFAWGFSSLFRVEGGWNTIAVDSRKEITAGNDFILQYDLGKSNEAIRSERRELTARYSDLSEEAYQIFNSRETFEGVTNLCTVNQNPGEILTVPEALYRAFELLQKQESRMLYLGPAAAEYRDFFMCQTDEEAAYYDPSANADMSAYLQQVADFARDPASIQLELLGENRVRLAISADYSAFAAANGIQTYLDFFGAENAFMIDYIADGLVASGYTRGMLASFDGFTRTFYESGEEPFTQPVYDREGFTVYEAGRLEYTGSRAVCSLYDYPLESSKEGRRYYVFADGRIITAYLSEATGQAENALDSLVLYGKTAGCAELYLRALPIWTGWSEEGAQTGFDQQADALRSLAEEGIDALLPEDGTLYYTEPQATLTHTDQDASHPYRPVRL